LVKHIDFSTQANLHKGEGKNVWVLVWNLKLWLPIFSTGI